MQRLKLFFAIIIPACLLSACSGNSPTSAGKDSTSNITSGNSGGNASGGNGSFSYTIDGNKVSVKSLFINEVTNNAADGRLKIEVTNTSTSEVFNFSIANTGTTTVLHFSPSLSNYVNKKTNEATYMSHKYKNYYGDSVIVIVTDINATHVAGTFAGKFLSDDDKPMPIGITDGSFDLPFVKN